MKKIKICPIILGLTISIIFSSCFKEENVVDPVIRDVKMYMSDVNSKDSLIDDIFAGKNIKIVVDSDADIITVWPGGIRTLMKKANNSADSIDLNGNPVLIESDHYSDYGLYGALGLKTSLMATEKWTCNYVYPNAGTFDLIVVATNHGYDQPDLRWIIQNVKVTVK